MAAQQQACQQPAGRAEPPQPAIPAAQAHRGLHAGPIVAQILDMAQGQQRHIHQKRGQSKAAQRADQMRQRQRAHKHHDQRKDRDEPQGDACGRCQPFGAQGRGPNAAIT